MNAPAQPVTLEQLARLFEAANQANRDLDAARRAKPRDPEIIKILLQRSSELNSAYDAARRRYKRQQKAAQRSAMLTTMIGFYLDHKEANSL